MPMDELLNLAVYAAEKAGDFLCRKCGITVDSCVGKDIKLSSDRQSEAIIIETLASSGIPILSEECGYVGGASNRHWIVDPLDGSMNYYKGLDDYACVSIALWENGKPVLGVINRFARGEVFTGLPLYRVAALNGKSIKPSDVVAAEDAVMATGFSARWDYSDDGLLSFFGRVRRFKKVRMLGAAALMAVFVACGRVDAYFEEDIMLWDIAAAMAIVQAAGGCVSYQPKDGYKCAFKCFSQKRLMEDFDA